MSCKSLVCAGLLCGLLVAPVAAQPSVSVDLVRDGGGLPVLSANGNWQWAISVTPDAFSSAVSVELGVQLDGPITSASLGDSIWDTSNPGSSIFGWEVTDGSDDDGLQVGTGANDNQAVLFVGSNVFAASSGSSLLATIEAGPPSATGGSLSTTIDIMGAYMGDGITVGGSNAIVAQQTADPDVISTVSFTFNSTKTATPGDTDLDGDVDGTDLARIGQNWDPTGSNANIWSDGNFDKAVNDNVDGTDLARVGQNWNPTGTGITPPGSGSSVVPEPTSAMLVVLAAGLAALAARRR